MLKTVSARGSPHAGSPFIREVEKPMTGRWLPLLLLGTTPLAAQDRSPPQGTLAQLGFMAGRWEGPAWMQAGPGPRREVHQKEWVSTAAGGTVITVIGQGMMRQPDGSDRLVHDAFAVIYRLADGTPALRAFTREGVWVDADVSLKDRGLAWSFVNPRAGPVRYTMTLLEDGTWNEIGEMERPGAGWVKFLEMNLRRVGD